MTIQSTIEELRSRAEVQLPDFKVASDLMNKAANLLEHLFKQVAQKDELLRDKEKYIIKLQEIDSCLSAIRGQADYRAAVAEKEKEIAWLKEHMEESDREFLQMQDWLIGNAEFYPKTGLIDRAEKMRERIRDLVVSEANEKELQTQLLSLEAVNVELRKLLEQLAEFQSPHDAKVIHKALSTPAPTPTLAKVREALSNILEHYVGLVNCRDCGNWNPEEEQQVKYARAVLALLPQNSSLRVRKRRRSENQML